MDVKKKRDDSYLGDVVEIKSCSFVTSTGLEFDFPFSMPSSITVEELNKYWHKWQGEMSQLEEDGKLAEFLEHG
jgi:hypothetical protein